MVARIFSLDEGCWGERRCLDRCRYAVACGEGGGDIMEAMTFGRRTCEVMARWSVGRGALRLR